MSGVVPFPSRKFATSSEAAKFVHDTFFDLMKRGEQAALSGNRDQMQVVIDIYDRDIIPHSPRYLGHLTADLLNFGQWLCDTDFIDRAIAIQRSGPPLDHLSATTEAKARGVAAGALGRALLVRAEFAPSGPFFGEAADCFEAALKEWREFDQYTCCHLSVCLGRARIAIAEQTGDEDSLRAGLAWFEKANPFHPHDGRSLDLAQQRLSEAKAQLFFCRRNMPHDRDIALAGVDQAIAVFGQWDHQYVIPPIWTERANKLKTALIECAVAH